MSTISTPRGCPPYTRILRSCHDCDDNQENYAESTMQSSSKDRSTSKQEIEPQTPRRGAGHVSPSMRWLRSRRMARFGNARGEHRERWKLFSELQYPIVHAAPTRKRNIGIEAYRRTAGSYCTGERRAFPPISRWHLAGSLHPCARVR